MVLERPAVAGATIVGSPHPIRGNVVKAFVVLCPGFTPSTALADDRFQFTRANLTPYEAPEILEFVSLLPKTISGKIRRIELRAKEGATRAGADRSPEEHACKDVKQS